MGERLAVTLEEVLLQSKSIVYTKKAQLIVNSL